jgi:hypothetical protein
MMKTPGVKATMMLCDHVAVAEGKMYINGGGWSVGGPGPMPVSIALLLHVPWTRGNPKMEFRLRLLFEDGQPVTVQGPNGETPVEVAADIEVGSPQGLKPGSTLEVPIPINLGPMGLIGGRRYDWELSIDGETEVDWHLPFEWRAAPVQPNNASGDPTNIPPAPMI